METVQHATKEALAHDLSEVSKCIYGNWISQVTYVFAELGVADALSSGPLSIDQLATQMQVQGPYLKRMLRCTFELGYLTFDQDTGLYHLTPKGDLLSSDHPQSKRQEARLNGAGYRYHPWGNLLHIVRGGIKNEYSPTMEHGTLDYLQDKPELRETFHSALSKKSEAENYLIIKDFDFGSFRLALDIGSGRGTFIKTILDHHPHLKGCMFDLPSTFTEGPEPKYEGRLTQIGGSFFEEVPNIADVYLMKNVIHNWPEDRAIELLSKVREAMISQDGITTPPEAKRLLVIENLISDDDDEHRIGNWMDLNFMIIINGAERSQEQYRALGARAGLVLSETRRTDSGRHILSFALSS